MLIAALLAGSCTFKSAEVPPKMFGRCNGAPGSCPQGLICTNVPTATGPMDLCCKTHGCANETVPLPAGVGVSEGTGGAKGSGGGMSGTPGGIKDAGSTQGRGGTGGMPEGTGGAGGVLMTGDAGLNPPLFNADAGRDTGTVGPMSLPFDAPPGCPGACMVGTKRCGTGAGVQVCADVQGCGAWAAETKCPGVQTCGGTTPNAACKCPPAPAGCEAGQGSFCEATTNALATCVADAQGCLTISGRITCAAGKPCTGSHPKANCSCPSAPAACAAGTGTSCQGNMLVTCALDTSGCLAVTTTLACPAGKPCAGNAPNSACTCPAAPTGCKGRSSGTFCSSVSAVATCSVDASGCVLASNAFECTNGCIGAHPGATCCVPTCAGRCGGANGCGGTCPNNCASNQFCDTDNVCWQCGHLMPNPASSNLPNAASYDTGTSGVVVDKLTGLMWERSGTGLTTFLTQAKAISYCSDLRTGGYSNWRIPTRIELISIVDFMAKLPAIDTAAFPNTPPSARQWTSTPFRGSPGKVFCVGFGTGSGADNQSVATDERSVRCVRRGGAEPTCPSPRFVANTGWVVDTETKLTWQQSFSRATWDAAKTACMALGSGARLPSLNELATLIDDSISTAPRIDVTAFPGTPGSGFWTSTVSTENRDYVFSLSFDSATAYQSLTTNPLPPNGISMDYARCVR